MKKIQLILFAVIVFISACKKEEAQCTFSESSAQATQAETDSIQRYLTANSISATLLPSGMYVKTNTAGTGAKPSVCNSVSVRYTGKTFANQQFDASGTVPSTFALGQTIVGFQKGLAQANAGSTVTLYIPPSLGYGAQEIKDANNNVIIPANSYLKFDIELVSVL